MTKALVSFSYELTPPKHVYTLTCIYLSLKISLQYHLLYVITVELTHKKTCIDINECFHCRLLLL